MVAKLPHFDAQYEHNQNQIRSGFKIYPAMQIIQSRGQLAFHASLAPGHTLGDSWSLLATPGHFRQLSTSRFCLQAGEDVPHGGEDDEEDEGGGEEGVAQHVHRQEELANHAAGGVPG